MLLKIITNMLKNYCLVMTKIHNRSIILAAVGVKLTCGAVLLSWFWPEQASIKHTCIILICTVLKWTDKLMEP